MTESCETRVIIGRGDLSKDSAIIIPKDIGQFISPFDVTRKKKCYLKTDDGPPPVLKEVDCKKIIIFEDKDDS